MNKSRRPVSLTRASLLVLGLFAITAGVGCSRSPTQPAKQARVETSNEQPKFSEVSSEPSDTGQVLALAEAAYAAKDWEAAEKHYVSTTRAIPKEATPWFRLGNIYARTDRPDFAVRAYKEALLRDPEMGKAWYNMGLVQLRQSANSFLQMRTYTKDNSESQIRADAMYEATIALIKDGPNRAKAFPYASGGTIDAPRADVLPAAPISQAVEDIAPPSEPEASDTEPAPASPEQSADEPEMEASDREASEVAMEQEVTDKSSATPSVEESGESQQNAVDANE